MRKFIYYTLIVYLLLSCNSYTSDPRLVQIDSVLNKNLYDSAYFLISKIDTNEYNNHDKAYYFLLRNHTLYRLDKLAKNDITILRSIKYYEKDGNKEKLARAYIGRGEILISQGKFDKATEYFKKAESLSKKIKNPIIKVVIYAHLSYINAVTENYNMALEYSAKALEYAEKTENKRWIGFCLDNLGGIYYSMKSWNNYEKYIKRAEPYISFQLPRVQAGMLDNQSSLYERHKQYDKAEECLKKSLAIYPTDRTYGLLAELYALQGRTADVEAMWKKALYSENLKTRQYTMRPYSEWLARQGRYKEALDIALQIPGATDSLNPQKQTEAIKEVQDGFDRKVADMKYQNVKRRIYAGIAILVVVMIAGWQYYRRTVQKARKRIAENQVMITDYSEKIRQLEMDGKEKSQEAKDLHRKLETLRDKQGEMLYKGKEKFEEIRNGGTTAKWHRADFNHVVEYYRTINMPFVISLEQDYKSLSASNKFFLLLTDEMKYGNDEICRIMNLTDGALRTMRYRIKQKMIS